MTLQQWDQHMEHFDDHIKWPASKEEIISACEGSDVEPSVLEEMKTALTESNKMYTKDEVKSLLLT